MSEYASYDYAWKTPGWTVQNPVIPITQDPTFPDDVALVRVFGSFLEWDTGRNVDGVVRFRVNKILQHTTTGQQVMPGEKRLRFRKRGFEILLPATDDPQLAPNGWEYDCLLTVYGHTQAFSFALPADPDEVNILSLIPVS